MLYDLFWVFQVKIDWLLYFSFIAFVKTQYIHLKGWCRIPVLYNIQQISTPSFFKGLA